MITVLCPTFGFVVCWFWCCFFFFFNSEDSFIGNSSLLLLTVRNQRVGSGYQVYLGSPSLFEWKQLFSSLSFPGHLSPQHVVEMNMCYRHQYHTLPIERCGGTQGDGPHFLAAQQLCQPRGCHLWLFISTDPESGRWNQATLWLQFNWHSYSAGKVS